MDDKQLLDAIQSIVSKETGKIREEMDARFAEQSSAIAAQMDARFAEQSSAIAAQMDARFAKQSSENKTLYENTFERIQNLLREDYGRVAAAAAKGAVAAASYDDLNSTVSDHERVLENHNDRLTVLEEKAI